jgi:23S rRNA pseudouridine1911/1915/1917 synthase
MRDESGKPLAVTHEALVDAGHAGTRLDVFLARHGTAVAGRWTRSAIQKMIADGRVTLNGRSAKPGSHVKGGDRVAVRLMPSKASELAAEPLPLEILYEDADCIVLSKAPGMVVHPAAGWKDGTLVNALLHHCPDLSGIGGERRPGIVHRLDKDTSGVMVVAKHGRALERLAAQFKDRSVRKEYLALVWGRMKKERGVIDRPIGRHRADRKRMSSVRAHARVREALTEWRVEEFFPIGPSGGRFSGVTLLRLRPHSGRTHQLRVHLADDGHPVVGDRVYGAKAASVESTLNDFPRQALHAERLEFKHPTTGAAMKFCAPLAPDMDGLLRDLKERRLRTSPAVEKGVDKKAAVSYYRK